ncbi:DUF4403 family protein [uncultured Sphingomonas sp.]|uniref:DUF4403 family protein n=1 Tax=uncultured Sphingomonas sp. TaxID=158754 RepID=UPI0025F70C3E|nr:DUF4403 family protein [uncultured Sphingomonas sp.]
MRRPPVVPTFAVLTLAAAIAGCSRPVGNPAPPQLKDGATRLPQQSSTIIVPVTADLASVERGLDAETPRTLWTIDQHRDVCVEGRRVAGVKVTPDLGCRLVGQVTRGDIRLSGRGERLDITMPVSARIAARDVGGIISKTATGSAIVHATAKLRIVGDWQPRATLDISYRWRELPGTEVAGQRITFRREADEKLVGIVRRLERDLPRQLERLRPRDDLQKVWAKAFTTIQLSKRNPPAWLRVTPRALGVGGYRVEGRQLRLTLAAEALTETFVGDRPPDPAVTPLPPPSRVAGRPGLRFFVPVLADYAQLEPVVERTLRRLAARGIDVPGVGAVEAQFGKVTVYATDGGRIAVGVQAQVRPRDGGPTTRGEVWLSALPYNAPDSQLVQARDVKLATKTDSVAVDLLVQLLSTVQVQQAIALALRHDFAPDYQKVLAKAQAAIGARREGDFLLSTDVRQVSTGQLQVTGAGLFLPVRAEGDARIEYRPR